MFGLKGLSLKAILGMAQGLGIDPVAIAEKKIPELLEKVQQLEAHVGSPLMATLMIHQEGYFIVSLYKILDPESGSLEMWKTYPIQDIKAIIEDLKKVVDHADETETGQDARSENGFLSIGTGNTRAIEPSSTDHPFVPSRNAGAAGGAEGAE